MNVLVLGSRFIGGELAKDLVRDYLRANFSGEERHVRRLGKVKAMKRVICTPSVKVAAPTRRRLLKHVVSSLTNPSPAKWDANLNLQPSPRSSRHALI